jgi:protein TonB
MFEDSTFESAGRIRTRSRRWMIAAFTFNASIVLAFVLIPLLYLEALPPQTLTTLITVPPAPQVQQPKPKPATQTPRPVPHAPIDPFTAPRQIPISIYIPKDPEPVALVNPTEDIRALVGTTGPLPGPSTVRVRQAQAGPMRISTAVEEGLLIHKTRPVYPPLAIAMRAQGTVVLAATISKAGNIENLRVVSGPPMLQQSSLDAVSTWRYKPYLLDGQPVEVETTVNVIFTLDR